MTDIAMPQLTADEARALTDEIRSDLTEFLPKIKRAFEGRADKALGYDSWQEYSAAELNDVRVPVGSRPAMAAELRSAGMSTRAIGSALGVSHPTVIKDLRSTGKDLPVDSVSSLDGRERPATQPPRTSTPEPEAEHHADLDAQLDAAMEGTPQRFRRNFSAVVARSDDVWQFDPERIAEVYAGDFGQAIRPFLEEMTRWCEAVAAAHRRKSGLRVVGGNR